jgi:hypothetical protein
MIYTWISDGSVVYFLDHNMETEWDMSCYNGKRSTNPAITPDLNFPMPEGQQSKQWTQ